MQWAGSTFLVTGGASGLGAATVRSVVAGGGNAVIADLNDLEGNALAQELGQAVRFVRTDVTDEASGKAAVQAAVDAFGGLQCLVNCAGVVYGEKVVGKEGPHSLAGFARTISINLIGTFNLIRLAVAAMTGNAPNADGERGVIVNTSSIAAFDGQIGQAAYASSKGGIVGMTLPVARDLAAIGVRVSTVAPGLIDTPIYGEGEQAEEFKARLGESVLFPKRLGEPDELASMVLECVRNSYMNGAVVRVDGGIRMPPK